MEIAAKKLIIALDDVDFFSALEVVKLTKSFANTFKVGIALFAAEGPAIVKEIRALGVDVFLDLKLHDIPMQIKKAIENVLVYAPKFLTIHALGGRKMLDEAASITRGSSTTLLAVSVLTSHQENDYQELGFNSSIDDGVLKLLDLAFCTGIRGFVSSPKELFVLRKRFGQDVFLVCPGIRPLFSGVDDQARVMSPKDAILLSADALVIGRPITKATNIFGAAEAVHQEIFLACEEKKRTRVTK